MMKLYMRNLHLIWKISTEKNFGKIEKKKFRVFCRIFLNFFLSALFGPKSCKTTILTIFRLLGNLLSAPPPKAKPRGAEGAIRRVFINASNVATAIPRFVRHSICSNSIYSTTFFVTKNSICSNVTRFVRVF